MVEMPPEVLERFSNPDCDKEKPLVWVATVTEDGNPHVAPVCFVKPLEKDKLLIAVSFISKTASNVKKGSKVALGCAVYPMGYMLKGSGEIISEGALFEDVKERVEKRFKGKIQAKAALLVEVEEVYSLQPKSGKKRMA